ncbi:MAG: transaldolase/glucose-6-phosphate isomerase [Candidatus Omnitrophota bacterium]|jgi:transaldolase/glucose-6-phosphate isomerase
MSIEQISSQVSWGSSTTDIETLVQQFEDDNTIARIRQKDASLWTDDATHHAGIKDRLGWMDVLDQIDTWVKDIDTLTAEIKDEGYRYIVLMAMGGSSLGPEVIQTILKNDEDHPELIVIDSTDPRRVNDVIAKIGDHKTLFAVASKSGTTVESFSLYKYFYNWLANVQNDPNPGASFIAITDPGMALVGIGEDKGFRKVFINPADIGGRYSVLSLFGLVYVGLIGADLDIYVGLIKKEIEATFAGDSSDAIRLGVSMGCLAKQGRDKLTIITPDTWNIFGDWAEQLIAESTGKEGLGVIPIVREPLVDAVATYGVDRYFVALLPESSSQNEKISAQLQALKDAGHPVMIIRVQNDMELGAQFFLWELACAISGIVLRIDPFDQPNVQEAKTCTNEILKDMDADNIPLPELSVLKPQLSIAFSNASKADAATSENWDAFVNSIQAGDYLNILAFMPDRVDVQSHLRDIANAFKKKTHVPTALGIGPRYLHSTGQLHKGGPDSGVFIVLTAPVTKDADLDIPEAAFTFQQLQLSQAFGDFKALESKGRRAVYIQLSSLESPAWSALKDALL